MSDQNQPDRDEDRILAGEYALGILSVEAAAAFEARLMNEPDLRAAYAQWAEDFTALTEDIAPQTPPTEVWRGIEAELFPSRDDAPTPWFRRVLIWGGGLAVAAVLVLVLGVNGLWERGPVRLVDAPYVAELTAEDRSLVVQALYDDATGTLFVERKVGVAMPGRALELWLIAGEAAPVSLGVMPEELTAVLQVSADLQHRFVGAVLAISDEPEGGSPTGAPTGEVLAVGPLLGS